MKSELIKVGYWFSEREQDLPMPQRGTMPVQFKDEVVSYLRNAETLHAYRGSSSCRLCGFRPNGSTCLTDGVYQWPQGLAHYIEDHDVILPDDFLSHIMDQVL